MVKVGGVHKMLLILRAILQIAEVDVPQRQVGVAVSPKPWLKVTEVMGSGNTTGILFSCLERPHSSQYAPLSE